MSPPSLARLEAIAVARAAGNGPAHDHLHVRRVAASARSLALAERADADVAVAAALLHELFNFPKDHPESARSGDLCAEQATALLSAEGCRAEFTERVAYAIRVHSFSRGLTPETLEAKILQDADRLDAIGAIGVARCFATCAEMKRPFYGDLDPFCTARAPDDKAFGLDHFYKKLLRIPDTLHTESARRVAESRMATMRQYLDGLAAEIG